MMMSRDKRNDRSTDEIAEESRPAKSLDSLGQTEGVSVYVRLL